MGPTEELIRALGDTGPAVRAAAAFALGHSGDPAGVQPLLLALSHDASIEVRATSARALGLLGAFEALPALLSALHDDPEVADSAADALAALGLGTGESMLALLPNPTWTVRRAAAAVLGRLGDPLAIDPLIHTLTDEHPQVRGAGAIALGEIGDARAALPLVVCLGDADPDVRFQAAVALGRIGGPEAIAGLRKVLQGDDQHPWVPAADALAILVGARILDPLIALFGAVREQSVGHSLASAVASVGEAALQPLLDALEHDDPDVRYWGVKALTGMGREEALSRLSWMAEHDAGQTPSKGQVRAAAARAMKRIGGRSQGPLQPAHEGKPRALTIGLAT